MAGSGSLVVNSSSLDSAVETTRIHSMPCSIDHDGDADVASYFDPIVGGAEIKTETGSNNSNEKGLTLCLTLMSCIFCLPFNVQYLIYLRTLKTKKLVARRF